MGVWQEIADYTVPNTTTSVVLDSFGTITKDDFVRIDFTHTNGASSSEVAIYPNTTASVSGYNTLSNYYRQALFAGATSIQANRGNSNRLVFTNGAKTNYASIYFKISENDKANFFSNHFRTTDSGLENAFSYVTSTISFPDAITSLTFDCSITSHIGTGTRIQIYKLAAEKVADITVGSNTTQVDISNLSIDKDSEYLLVSDVSNGSGSGNYYELFPNDLTTSSGYYRQQIEGDGSTARAGRGNFSDFLSISGNLKNMSYTHIKLSNIGAFTYQTYALRDYGTTSPILTNRFTSSTSEAITSITKLNIKSFASNGIATGSTFVLYKLY